jgi:predicted ATPase/DNA-binding winged helix-turn-helix (wHTH) protein
VTRSDHVLLSGRVEIRTAERQLLIDGESMRLGARAFDVLLALVERRDRAVSKQELFDLVWPGRVVEDNNLQVQVWALRKLLGPAVIATIPGHGYRFVSPVAATPGALANAAARVTAALPGPPTLFGRARELEEAQILVRAHRLVSVVGASGIGKSALALALASALQHEFADVVGFVDLSATVSGDHLASAISRGLQLASSHETTAAVAAELRAGRRLIVLDNCERLLPAVAEFAAGLLRTAPRLHLVVTGQESLRLPEEQVYRLGALAVPAESDRLTLTQARTIGAVQLFEHRVRAMNRHFEVSDGNLSSVIDICRRLDGVALAIELAAARVPLLAVEGLRARLEENTRLLDGVASDATARRRTLNEALEWSHGMLSPPQQAVLRRLAVMTGSFDLAAAQGVVADAALDEWSVLDEIGVLAERSLVAAERMPKGEMRYRLLGPVRQFAMGQLVEAAEFEEMRDRHVAFFMSSAERARDAPTWEQRVEWLHRLGLDSDNLSAAVVACDDGAHGVEHGLRLVNALTPYWMHNGLLERAHQAAVHALARPGTGALPELRARTLLHAGVVCSARGDEEAALSHVRECVELCRTGNVPDLLCESLARLGTRYIALNDPAAARTCIDEASALARRAVTPMVAAIVLGARAELEEGEGHFAEAQSMREGALRHARATGDREQAMMASNRLALAALKAGDSRSASAWLDESLAIDDPGVSTQARVETIDVGATLAAHCSQWALAVRLAGAADVRARRGRHPGAMFRTLRSSVHEPARAVLGAGAYEATLADGHELSIAAAVALLQTALRTNSLLH